MLGLVAHGLTNAEIGARLFVSPRTAGHHVVAILRKLDLQAAAARSTRVGDEEMPDDVRWIRSYVLDEGGGSVGTLCLYEAASPEAIREHARRADLPVDEIVSVADTVIVRPDPITA